MGKRNIRILLLNYDLKPWREKMWVVADLDEEYIAKWKMYQRRANSRTPRKMQRPMGGIADENFDSWSSFPKEIKITRLVRLK